MQKNDLLKRFIEVRKDSISICKILEIEDYVVQPSEEVSPIKWHLGHTSWFFEEMILLKYNTKLKRYNSTYNTIFNSYYKSAGIHWKQNLRGQLSRPTVKEIISYRKHINIEIKKLLKLFPNNQKINFLMELGINHEEQHQELMHMDIKYIFNSNPQKPKYANTKIPKTKPKAQKWENFDEGVYLIGNDNKRFSYDNEKPQHKVYIHPFKINKQYVTNNEYKKFIDNKGYQKPQYWLSKGWEWVNFNNISAPQYWNYVSKNNIKEFTLHGLQSLNGNAPVCHISYYEASAYAKWANSRLPTEEESEIYLKDANSKNTNLNISKSIYQASDINLSVNNLWWWTKSHYSSYPGFKPFHKDIEEYNEKFMCGQFVLKGGSIATPSGHIRNTYRNFYEPHQRWMFSGIRLARDIK
jgi:ergothioneine biosynthesis protein EgtB